MSSKFTAFFFFNRSKFEKSFENVLFVTYYSLNQNSVLEENIFGKFLFVNCRKLKIYSKKLINLGFKKNVSSFYGK